MSIKIMQLNALQGTLYYPLRELITTEKPDVMCFQEMASNPSAKIHYFATKERLTRDFPEYRYVHHFPAMSFTVNDEPCSDGSTIFSRIPLTDYETIVHETGYRFGTANGLSKSFIYATQFVRVMAPQPFLLVNHYGLIDGASSSAKHGTPDTDKHAQAILDHIRELGDDRVVMCGDFNVMPDSSTIKLISRTMRDLVSESGAKTTRPPNCVPIGPHVCDYIFTSPAVGVKKFLVADKPTEICSDHLALFAEIE